MTVRTFCFRWISVLLMSITALVCHRAFADGATVEGIVRLPKTSAPAPVAARYQGGASETIAPPEPPAAVVYLEGNFGVPAAATNATVQLSQKNLQFSTSLLPVLAGTTVEFPNQDDIYHNVFSYSKTKRFDLGRYLKDEKPPAQKFDKPGVVKLYCEIHSHMRATILVLD